MATKIESFFSDLIQNLNEKSEKNGVKFMIMRQEIFVNFNDVASKRALDHGDLDKIGEEISSKIILYFYEKYKNREILSMPVIVISDLSSGNQVRFKVEIN
jgi:hypothetical protein